MHELGGRVYTVNVHAEGDVKEDISIVEYHLDAGVHHQVCDLLSGGGGGGDDADHLLRLVGALFKLIYMLDDDVADGTPNLLRVVIEDVVDHEPPLGQNSAARDS